MLRENCFAGRYAWIAMVHYAEAKTNMKEFMKIEEYNEIAGMWANRLENNVAISVTFSAMALESFFNDYAAYKLGDKFFYDNCEMLRAIGKLQLIAKFVLRNELDKGECVYQLVDKLFKRRNEYVHNKSGDGHSKMMTEQKVVSFNECLINLEMIKNEENRNMSDELKKASEAIKAICEVAKLFDPCDEEYNVMFCLLSARAVGKYDRQELMKIREVQREYKIDISLDVDEV